MSVKFPLVSIVMPVYNHEKFVVEALNSIFLQKYPCLEVIIIDDGSKDRSAELVEEWLQKILPNKQPGHSFTFIRQKNQGAHATINRGLSMTKGDFLTILNSDDVYDVNRIEKLMQRLHDEQGEFIFSTVRGIDEKSQPVPFGHPWRSSYEGSLYNLASMPSVGFQLMYSNLAISTGNMLFSRNIYQQVGEFTSLKLAHDYEFLLRALLLTEPIFYNEELYLYRLHGSNTFTQLNDIVQKELNEIFRGYLLTVSANPPANLQAPCHWYWPLTFSWVRSQSKMDRCLAHYFRDEENAKESPKQASIPNKIPTKSKNGHKQKISLITHDLSLNGAPKVVADLARYLKEQGHTVKVVSLYEGPMRQELEAHQIPIYVLPKKITKGMFHTNVWMRRGCTLLNSLLLLFKVHRTTIGNTYWTGQILTILSRLNPFYNLIWYLHESFPPSTLVNMGAKNLSLIERAKRNPRFQLWFGSNSTRKLWEQSGFKGSTKYWSGIAANQSLVKLTDRPITEILSLGTTCARKGTHYLIEAFILGIKEKRIQDNVRLTIIGFYEDISKPIEYIGDLIVQTVQSGFKDRIRFIETLQPAQIENYYQQADLYVQSSVVECLPLALLQAMSLGLPIVTTDANGCSEAIEDGKTGYVCHARNSRVLLNTILKALNDPKKSREMGREAQKVFNEKFCIEKNYEGILAAL